MQLTQTIEEILAEAMDEMEVFKEIQPTETKSTKTMSKNFPMQKVYRSKFQAVNGLHTGSATPASDFLNIAASVVCENVDTKHRCHFKNGDYAHCYLTKQQLKEKFNVVNFEKILKRLDLLKNVYHIIDYVITTNRNGKTRVYFQVNENLMTITKGSYSYNNTEARNTAIAALNNEGFFFINKILFIHVFFNEHNPIRHGVKDTYWLLYFNAVFQDDTANEITKYKYVTYWNTNQGEASPFITYPALAEFLHTARENVQRHIHQFLKNNLIEKIFFRNRGTIIFIVFDETNNKTHQIHKTSSQECDFLVNHFLQEALKKKGKRKKTFTRINTNIIQLLKHKKTLAQCLNFFHFQPKGKGDEFLKWCLYNLQVLFEPLHGDQHKLIVLNEKKKPMCLEMLSFFKEKGSQKPIPFWKRKKSFKRATSKLAVA